MQRPAHRNSPAAGVLSAAGAGGVLPDYPRDGQSVTIGPRAFRLGALIILLAGLALRIWQLGTASLWTDEALTALRAEVPLRESLKSIAAAGNQTPLYFWSLRLVPHSTEALLRLPSVLAGMLGIALIMAVTVGLYHDRELALWTGALLAVDPFHVWLSRTARPYALMFLLSLLTAYLFLRLLRGERSRRMWIAFTLSSTLTYATHFTCLALPAAEYITFALVIRKEYKLFRGWIVTQVIAAAPVLAWAFASLYQPHTVASEWIPHPAWHDLPLTLWNMSVGYDGTFRALVLPGLVLVSLSIVAGLTYGLRGGRRDLRNFFWALLILAPLLPVFIASRYVVSIYVDRYFTVFLPALLILVVLGTRFYAGKLWRLALAVLVATGLYNVLVAFSNGSFRRADWRDAAAYVAEGIQPDDVILLERENTREVFLRYYRQDAARLRLPGPPTVFLLSNPADMAALAQSGARVWAVYRNPNEDIHRMGLMPDWDPWDPTLSAMGAWLSPHHPLVIEQRAFHGVQIFLLESGQPANPAAPVLH